MDSGGLKKAVYSTCRLSVLFCWICTFQRNYLLLNLSKRRLVLWFFLAVILICDIFSWLGASKTDLTAGRDFIGYWASGRLYFEGENPYSSEALLALMKSLGYHGSGALIAWAPPWIHILLWPFEILPFRAAKAAWFIFNLILLLWTSARIWRRSGGHDSLWIPLFGVFFFAPSFLALNWGSAPTAAARRCSP